ncbi:hypothetical protein DRH29_02755 [candidate division Kazan bacterium]|uniref:Uncharacterized protein n=1 Tax=candidate division Kazan bacterium TaxID=2202143 RepID=A0A420ZCJ2_UNCK3|nr:MAG: hypothetical protein DRH29_02755 [candidate division Kazan bacterium]
MPNAKAVAEIPWRGKYKVDLNNPTATYLNNPALIFSITKNLKLLLTVIEITHLGNQSTANKTIKVVHRTSPPAHDPNAGAYDWDYEIATYTGNSEDKIFNESHFEKIYILPGDSLIIYWDNTYDATANVTITFRQV